MKGTQLMRRGDRRAAVNRDQITGDWRQITDQTQCPKCTLARKREGGSAMQMGAAPQLNYSARLDS